jgi:hypothetical protein
MRVVKAKKGEMGRTRSIHGEKKNACRVFEERQNEKGH